MAVTHTEFQLMVSWDHAVLAIDHAIERGRRHYTVLDRDNGYLRIREPGGVTLDIDIRIEGPDCTRIGFSNKRRWLDLSAPKENQVSIAMRDLREDVVTQLLSDMAA